MPKKGLHPLIRTMRVVMRNGASFQVQTVLNRPLPYMLQVVSEAGRGRWGGKGGGATHRRRSRQPIRSRSAAESHATPRCCAHLQDTTTNPLWTGEKPGLSLEDERLKRVVGRYTEFVGSGGGADSEEDAAPQRDQ